MFNDLTHNSFAKGPGPLVSVLIPSRGRPQRLADTIGSLWDKAIDKNQIEFVLKIDEDDPETVTTVRDLIADGLKRVKIFVSPRGRGYLDLHIYLNDLCKHAEGDWLVIFNDDAIMETEGWDDTLVNGETCMWEGLEQIQVPELLRVYVFQSHSDPASTAFFAIRKASSHRYRRRCYRLSDTVVAIAHRELRKKFCGTSKK